MSPKKLSPNNLTSTQLGLLSAAAQREDGAIELAPNLKGAAADKVVGKLLRDGLIEEIPARGALPIWRRDEEKEAVALRMRLFLGKMPSPWHRARFILCPLLVRISHNGWNSAFRKSNSSYRQLGWCIFRLKAGTRVILGAF